MIDIIKRMLRIDRSRRFRHKSGFLDKTHYIQIEEDGAALIVPHDAPAYRAYCYSLERCLEFVREGNWVELKAWQ